MSASTSDRALEQLQGMSRVVSLSKEGGAWSISPADPTSRVHRFCAELEAGNILFFPVQPFPISQDDRDFLLGRTQTSSALHKNIAYRPAQDRITGLARSEHLEAARLRLILKNYSQGVEKFLAELLTPYAGKWKLDFASFRPIEERGRTARLHARNDLPHFDAFPTRPTLGDRILRFFSNINPTQGRVWNTSQTFEAIGPEFAKAIGLPGLRSPNPLARGWRNLAAALHLPGSRRSPYDDFMHRCHNAMKEDAHFRESCPKQRWEFPPNSSWMVFTDGVSHAVLQGQYALEQTFIVSRAAMVEPQRSPIAILEKIAGHPLAPDVRHSEGK